MLKVTWTEWDSTQGRHVRRVVMATVVEIDSDCDIDVEELPDGVAVLEVQESEGST